MVIRWLLLSLLFSLTACTAAPAMTPTPLQMTCAGFITGQDQTLDCIELSEGNHLLQTATTEQVRLEAEGLRVTLQGTLYSQRDDSQWLLAVLEGSAVVGAANITRIIQPGAQVTLPIDADGEISGEPSGLLPLDTFALGGQPLNQLPRAVDLPAPIPPPADATLRFVTPVASPTPEIILLEPEATPLPPGVCIPNEAWSGRYFIQRGDNLSRVARSYGLTLEQLAEANCIDDPNRVFPGQELRVPQTSEAPPVATLADLPNDFRPTLVIMATPTYTPSAIAFRADRLQINEGDCTTIRWDVFNVEAVFFDDEDVPLSGSLRVCPEATTDYSLRIRYFDGTEAIRSLLITVATE